MTGVTADRIILAVGWYIVFVFSATFHEASHAYVARRGGDPTAYFGGQVTLDPIPHIRREPFGMILVPIVSFFMWGWMIGWASTPYDPFWARRFPRQAAIMSLAGPAANLLLVACAGAMVRVGILLGFFSTPDTVTFVRVVSPAAGVVSDAAATLVSILFTLNIVLFVFNMIPLPPLDGSGILPLVIGRDNSEKVREITRRPFFMLFCLIIVWRVFGYIFGPIFAVALSILYPGSGFR